MTERDEFAWLRAALAGRFEIERLVGEDHGLVEVLARDPSLERHVVVAALAPQANTPARRDAFLDQAKLLGRVEHPNVRAVHDASRDAGGGIPMVVLEHLEGSPLEVVLRDGPLTTGRARRLAVDLFRGLEASHAKGVARPSLSTATVVCQPERAVLSGLDALEADAERRGADLAAAAAIVYEAATGRRWDSAQRGASLWADVPWRLRPALRRALAPRARDRFADARAARLAFERRAPLPTPGRRTVALAVGMGLVLVLLYRALNPPTPPGQAETELAVVPLHVVGVGGADSLGVVVSGLVRQSLETAPNLRLASPREVIRWWERQGGDASGVQPDLARKLNAHWVVYGSVSRVGDDLRVRLTLYDTAGGRRVLPEFRGRVDDVVDLSQHLSLEILHTVRPDLERRVGPLRDFEGVPYDALTAFLQGEAAFDRDAWTLAQKNYETAVAADPSFALARWRLINVKRWRRLPYDFFDDLHAFAAELGPRLRPNDRAVVEALLEPGIARRLELLDSLVARAPDDAYIRFLYAEELFHRGPLVGHGIERAVDAMEKTIELDSSFAEAYNHVFAVRLRTGDKAQAKRYLSLRRRVSLKPWPGDPDIVRLLELAYDERFIPWWGGFKLWALAHWGDTTQLADAARVSRLGAAWFDLPETEIEISRILVDRGPRTDSAQASARTGLAIGLLTLGRPAAALAQLDSAVALAPSEESRLQQAEWRTVPHAVGLPVDSSADNARWSAALGEFAQDRVRAPRALWAMALGRLGSADTDGFLALARRLDTLAPGHPLAVLLHAVAKSVAGDPAAALAVSDSVGAIFGVNDPPDPFAGAAFHLLRGAWYAAPGTRHDLDAADREWLWYEGSDFKGWPAGVPQAGEIEAAFAPYARYKRFSARLTSGVTAADTASACAMLHRVAELWAGAEQAMRPLRDTLAQRLHACP